MGGYADFMGRLEWVNIYGKKQCRSLYWRMKAALKKAMKNRSKQELKFQYDPSSYALNFEDGCCHSGEEEEEAITSGPFVFQDCSDCKNAIWVYVLWVKS